MLAAVLTPAAAADVICVIRDSYGLLFVCVQDGRDGESQVAAAGVAPVPGRQDGAERGAAAEAGGGERGDSGQNNSQNMCKVLGITVATGRQHRAKYEVFWPLTVFLN